MRWMDNESCCPVAYVAVRDERRREQLTQTLHGRGWAVVDSATGYHLVQSLSPQILDDRRWLHPSLIVVDAVSPGCSGVTIARGLRELGWRAPVVVLAESPAQQALLADDPDDGLYVADAAIAPHVVAAVADAVAGAAPPPPKGPDALRARPVGSRMVE